MNPGRLKLELFCFGARLDPECALDRDTRPIKRTRGGLGSGLDAILPGGVWVNIPLFETFVSRSPFRIVKRGVTYQLWRDDRPVCDLRLPPRPRWYEQRSTDGRLFGEIGVMQGTYFSIYPSELCGFWAAKPRRNCRFCSVGLCLGQTESETKTVRDVVEAVRAARRHERITFVHFNTGFLEDDRPLELILPYVEAVKRETGLLIGVQCPPAIDLTYYDRLKNAGANHLSFCFELFDPDRFARICPGKAESFGRAAEALRDDPLLRQVAETAARFLADARPHSGQLPFYRALAYCVRLFGKGRISGETIAGLEPPRRSIQAAEFLAALGAVNTVCVFRPCLDTDLSDQPPPDADELAPVFARMYEVCVAANIPVGLAPNIKTAMVHLPEEGRWLSTHPADGAYRAKATLLRTLYRGAFSVSRLGK